MTTQITTGTAARTFALAGKARLTLVSVKTGTRFTFRVKAKKVAKGEAPTPPWFVSVLTGRNNNDDYTFLGTIFEDKLAHDSLNQGGYRHNHKSSVSSEAPSVKGFVWAWRYIVKGELPPGCEVWHEGTCGRCGLALTVPESIARGLGPECADGGGY